MSRPSIRPRPLDVNRKLKLLKTPEDFEDDEDAIIRSSNLTLLPDSDKVQIFQFKTGNLSILLFNTKKSNNFLYKS